MTSWLRAILVSILCWTCAWGVGCAGDGASPATPSEETGALDTGADGAPNEASRTVIKLEISPANGFVSCRPLALRALATFADGVTEEVTSAAKWFSSDDSIVRISPGLASPADKSGTVTITATYLEKTATASIQRTPCSEKIDVSPVSASIAAGSTQQFVATWTAEDGVKKDVSATTTWKSSDETVATVDATGLAKALKRGSVLITGTYSGYSSTATLTIEEAPLDRVEVTPGATTGIAGGPKVSFKATAIFKDLTTSDVTLLATWSSSAPAIATVDSTGSVTPLSGGIANISATYLGKTGTGLIFMETGGITTLTLTPVAPSIAKGTTQAFTATATMSDGSTSNVTSSCTWVSSNPAVATVSATGVATGVSPGTTEIKATIAGISGSATLKISGESPTITISPLKPTVAPGAKQAFVATAAYSDGTTSDVTTIATWTSSSTTVATIDAKGVATAIASGTTTITAKVADQLATATLTVGKPVPTSIALTPTGPLNLYSGVKQTFTAIATYASGVTEDVSAVATFASSGTGLVEFAKNVGTPTTLGSAKITATLEGVTSNEVSVVVLSCDPVSISISKPIDLPFGATQRLKAMVKLCDDTERDFTESAIWTSSDDSIASVSMSSSTRGLVAAKASGSVDIGATFASLAAPKVKVNVKDVALTSIAVTPGTSTLVAGMLRPYTALGTYADGTTADVTLSPLTSWAIVDVLEVVVPSYTASVSTAFGSVTVTTTGGTSTYPTGRVVVRARQSGVSGRSDLFIKDPISLAVTCATYDGVPAAAKLQCLPSGIGYRVRCRVEASLSDGSSADVTADAKLDASDAAVTKLVSLSSGAWFDVIGNGKSIVFAAFGSLVSWKKGDPDPSAPGQVAMITAGTRSVTALSMSASSTMTTGGTQDAHAVATFGAASGCPTTGGPELADVTFDVTPLATWTSANTSVATVSSSGSVAAIAVGKTTLGATFGGKEAATEVTVSAP